MKIRKATDSDVENIIRIHMNSFPRGLMTFMGTKYLERTYMGLVRHSEIGLVCEDESYVVRGFVFSKPPGPSFSRFNLKLGISILFSLIKNFWTLMPLLLSRIHLFLMSYIQLKKVVYASDFLELAYIAIDESLRSNGIGRELIKAFEQEANSILGYTLCSTRTHNERLTAFYIKNKKATVLFKIKNRNDYSCVLCWNLN